MKKNLTRVFMLVATMVISLSLILGLAGCGLSGNEGYATAEENWKAAESKSAVDTIKVEMDLSEVVGMMDLPIKITIDITIEREYGAEGQLIELSGNLDKVEVTGASNITSLLGSFELGDFDINAILNDDGSIVLTNIANGTIEYIEDESQYEISGGLSIPELSVNLNSDKGPVIVAEADVVNGMAELGVSIPFDILSLFDISAGTIDKKNTATIDGDAALNWITVQLLDLAKAYFSGTLEMNGEVVVVDPIATNVFDAVAGGTSQAQLEALMADLFILEDVEATITYDGDNFDTIKTSNNMGISIARSDISDIMAQIDLGDSQQIVTSVMNLLNSQFTIGISMSVETKITIG